MIKNLKKLLPLAGTFLGLITLFCCDSTLIEDLDAIARKKTEGTYIYQTIIQKQHIDDNNYDTEAENKEILNQPKTSTELKQWISDAIDKNSTYGFILSNTPEVEHPEDNLYRLVLTYDRELYTLDFNENTTFSYEGTIPQSQTQRYEKLITLEFPELKQTNYMFLGWDENNTAVSPAYTTDKREFTFYKDTTLYAIWQKGNATYTVYHYLQGLGVDQDSYTEILSQETLAGFAGQPTEATALTFPGYEKYLNNIALKDSIEQQTISADGTTKVFVYYDRNKFTIYLDLAGGIFDTETETPASPVGVGLVYGQDVAASITPFKRTGYTFTEWVPELPKTMEYTYKDITYEAQWDLIYYTIRYIVNGTETTATYTVESETITLPVPAETEGYTFEGWYKDPAFADETKVEQIPQGSTGNITLYAKWEPVIYTITYIVNGAEKTFEGYASKYTIETATITALPVPAETEGYTFAGWYTDPEFADGKELAQIPQGSTGNFTLYAKWEPVIYTITYIVNGKEITFDGYASTYTIETETITALPVPEEDGFSFEGWFTNPAFADETKVEQIPQGSTGNITLYAKMTETSSGIKYTTPAVSFIEATITPTDDTFDTTTISDTDIKFQVDTDTLVSSEQMTSPLTCQWYLDGIQQSTDPTDPTALNISYDSLTAGSHILTVIITDSDNKIATGTKQFVVIK